MTEREREARGVAAPHDAGEVLRGCGPALRGGRMWGFGPTRRNPFVSAKGPKTMGAQARPHKWRSVVIPSETRNQLFQAKLLIESLRGSGQALRSNSPRPHIRFGTAAQPRLQAPWKWRHGMARLQISATSALSAIVVAASHAACRGRPETDSARGWRGVQRGRAALDAAPTTENNYEPSTLRMTEGGRESK